MPGSQDVNTVKILPAGLAHLGEIAALAEVVWRAHYPGIISVEQIDYMLKRMYDLKVLRAELAQGICYERLLVRGELRAFAAYGPWGGKEEMKLYKIYIHPESQRQGLGSRLLHHVEEKARERNFKVLLLTVNKGNEKAIAAYRKNGFRVRETAVVDIGGGFVMDDFIMAKRV
jgi:GNAT superfamily N-acetyltransferase